MQAPPVLCRACEGCQLIEASRAVMMVRGTFMVRSSGWVVFRGIKPLLQNRPAELDCFNYETREIHEMKTRAGSIMQSVIPNTDFTGTGRDRGPSAM